MTAAIYARKSTEQDDARSVTRQIDHARAYAARKGWHVADEHVYVDDGISGAEFANRPGFLRLMNTLKPRAPFQVLVMSEESRLGREAIETAFALKQLVTAGVRVFFYLEDRERTLDSPTDKIMLSLTTFADELEREKARQRTHDALARKARAGHVTGGRVFGYRNVNVMTTAPDGTVTRSHVERAIDEPEAAVVRRIFEMCADGAGKTRIAKTLNAAGAPAPRAQQGRPKAWAPSSVHEALYRDLYRGVIVWNRTRKRNAWGQARQRARPDAEWMRMDAPHLRIVSDDLWRAAHARLTESRGRYLRATDGRLYGRPRDDESAYLLTGFCRCASCGAVFHVRTRQHGRTRAHFFGCSGYWRRGTTVCENRAEVPLAHADDAVLAAIEAQVFAPGIVDAVIERTLDALAPEQHATRAAETRRALAAVEAEMVRLSEAIASGGELAPLMEALQHRQARRAALQAALDAAPVVTFDRERMRREARARLRDWRSLLRRQPAQGRQILRKILEGPIGFAPAPEGGYTFAGKVNYGKVFGGFAPVPQSLASPAGFEPASPP